MEARISYQTLQYHTFHILFTSYSLFVLLIATCLALVFQRVQRGRTERSLPSTTHRNEVKQGELTEIDQVMVYKTFDE